MPTNEELQVLLTRFDDHVNNKHYHSDLVDNSFDLTTRVGVLEGKMTLLETNYNTLLNATIKKLLKKYGGKRQINT